MLTSADLTSGRVKAAAFHPVFSWLALALHNGQVLIWDYRYQVIVDRYEYSNIGAARSIDFHPSQPLFAAGGDDQTVKIYNHETKKLLFTIQSHVDFVRAVKFHPHLPWILTCSDDQMASIHNWQNRETIASITGHNHYVMSAAWHPTDPLIVTGSMDSTVRVWSYANLQGRYNPGQGGRSRQRHQLPDDIVQLFVINSHQRGVNSVAFHPTLDMILSGADDKTVRIHRYKESMWWATVQFTGHTGNVEGVAFIPSQDRCVSASDDKTVRIWDIHGESGTASEVDIIRREQDRFWAVEVHPTSALMAVGHDGGAQAIKLARERRPTAVPPGINDERVFVLESYYLSVKEDSVIQTLVKVDQFESEPNLTPKNLFLNVLNSRGLQFIIDAGPKGDKPTPYIFLCDLSGGGIATQIDMHQGVASGVAFVSRNRIAALNSVEGVIELLDNNHCPAKTLKCPVPDVSRLYFAGNNRVLLRADSVLSLLDLVSETVIGSIDLPAAEVCHIVWNNLQTAFAVVYKKTVMLVSVRPEIMETAMEVQCIHQASRFSNIKSLVYMEDSENVLYTTHNHTKFLLPRGDSGITQSWNDVLYLQKAKDDIIIYLSRRGEGQVQRANLSIAELKFKDALETGDINTVAYQVKNSHLIGSSVIAHLQRRGRSEIALGYVEDLQTKFNLALASSQLTIAKKAALSIGSQEIWARYADAALNMGALTEAEAGYRKTNDLPALLNLYSVSGAVGRIKKLMSVAERTGNASVAFQCALLIGDTTAMEKHLPGISETERWDSAVVLNSLDERKGKDMSLLQNWNVRCDAFNRFESAKAEQPKDEPRPSFSVKLESADSNEPDENLNDDFENLLEDQPPMASSNNYESVGHNNSNGGFDAELNSGVIVEGTDLATAVLCDPGSWNSDLFATGSISEAMRSMDEYLGIREFGGYVEIVKLLVLGSSISLRTCRDSAVSLYLRDNLSSAKPDRYIIREKLKSIKSPKGLYAMVSSCDLEQVNRALEETRYAIKIWTLVPRSERPSDDVALTVSIMRLAHRLAEALSLSLDSTDLSAPEHFKQLLYTYGLALKIPLPGNQIVRLVIKRLLDAKNHLTGSALVKHYLAGLDEQGTPHPPGLVQVLQRCLAVGTDETEGILFHPGPENVCTFEGVHFDGLPKSCPVCGSIASAEAEAKVCRVCELSRYGYVAREHLVE